MTKYLFRLWVTLLAISGGIALWFSVIALAGVWKYSRLNAQTTAEVSNWQVTELSSSRFGLEAEYCYTVKGTVYSNKTLFENKQFLNRFAADKYIQSLDSKRWRMWYRESNPAVSSMERQFPQKKCMQAILTIGVLAYFYFARSMISRVLG